MGQAKPVIDVLSDARWANNIYEGLPVWKTLNRASIRIIDLELRLLEDSYRKGLETMDKIRVCSYGGVHHLDA